MKNKGGIIALVLGLLIILRSGPTTEFLIPWYLHLIFGLALIIYGVVKYTGETKKNKIVPLVVLVIAVILSYHKVSSINNANDASHPFWNAETRVITTNVDDIQGLAKLKKDQIFIQLNETGDFVFDSVNVLVGNEIITSNKVTITSILDHEGLLKRASTRKNFFIAFKDHFEEQDTIRFGLHFDRDFFNERGNIEVKFYRGESCVLKAELK